MACGLFSRLHLLESRTFVSRYLELRFVRSLLVVGAVVLGIALFANALPRPTHVPFERKIFPPALYSIVSSPGRTETLEELLTELRSVGVREGDTLQAYPSMAMLYFRPRQYRGTNTRG